MSGFLSQKSILCSPNNAMSASQGPCEGPPNQQPGQFWRLANVEIEIPAHYSGLTSKPSTNGIFWYGVLESFVDFVAHRSLCLNVGACWKPFVSDRCWLLPGALYRYLPSIQPSHKSANHSDQAAQRSPATLNRIEPIQKNRQNDTPSPSQYMPTMAVPAAPMPVQTA